MNILLEHELKSHPTPEMITEATYYGALRSIEKKLKNRFKESAFVVERNSQHRCVDVKRGGQVVAQVYPGAVKPAKFQKRRLQRISKKEAAQLPDDAPIYTPVTGEAFGPAYSSKDDCILVKAVSDVGNGDLLKQIQACTGGDIE